MQIPQSSSQCVLSQFSFVTPWTVAHQASLSMGIFKQEYRSGLPFPSPGDLLTQGLSLRLLHWQVDSLPLSHLGSLKAPIGTGISDRLQNLPSLHDPKKQMIFLSPGIKAENQSVTGLGITSMRLIQKGA